VHLFHLSTGKMLLIQDDRVIILDDKVLYTDCGTYCPVSNSLDIPPAEARIFFMLEVLRLIKSGSTGSLQPAIQPKGESESGDRPKIGLRSWPTPATRNNVVCVIIGVVRT
jgi:hypothetical protein